MTKEKENGESLPRSTAKMPPVKHWVCNACGIRFMSRYGPPGKMKCDCGACDWKEIGNGHG